MIDLGLKVLISTYHEAFIEQGGGEHEIHEINSALQELGVASELYGPTSRPLKYYDSVLHFSLHGGGLSLLETVKAAGKRIVLWPNIWLRDDAIVDFEAIQKQVNLANCVVFRSQAEAQNLMGRIKIPQEKVAFVRTGVRAFFGEPADQDLFRSTYGVNDYILWLGLIEPVKNQLTAIQALREIEIPVLFVGGYRDKAYYEECIKAAPAHFRFLPHIPPKSELLRSALQNCLLYLETPLEPAGLSAIEAGLAGAKLVLSDNSWTREHFGESIEYVDSQNPSSIRTGVLTALDKQNGCSCKTSIQQKFVLPGAIADIVPLLKG